MLTVFGIVAAYFALFVSGLRSVRKTERISPKSGAVDGKVIAFVPARNEAEVIEDAVRSLAAQEGLEAVVVIDDGSTDDTPEILARLAEELENVVVLTSDGPNPGECGKPAALRDAVVRESRNAEWLLFVDADVVLEAGAAAGLLEAAKRQQVDFLSVFPQLEMNSAIEQVVLPAVGSVIVAHYPPPMVSNPKSKKAFLNGQIILAKRSAYESIGGHDSVVREVLEDVRLGQIAKAKGAKLLMADGAAIAKTRMYADWGEMREGWTKNLFLLMGRSPATTLFWAVTVVLAGGAGVLALIAGGWPHGAIAYAVILGMQMILRGRVGGSPLWSLLAPVAGCIVAWLLLESWWKTKKGKVNWKGRTYDSKTP